MLIPSYLSKKKHLNIYKYNIHYPQKKVKKLLWIILPLIVLIVYALNIYPFLSDSHPVENANVLVAEGWLPPDLLDKAVEEFESKDYEFIATTGVPFLPEFRMAYGGYLIYDFSDQEKWQIPQTYTLEVEAYSTPVNNEYAEMALFINDSLVFEGFTNESAQIYKTKVETNRIDSLAILFKNDAYADDEDRDLIIVNVRVNGKDLPPRSPNVIYDRGRKGGNDIYSANFNSVAEEAALELQRRGIPKDKIIAVPTEEREINRTYNSALAFGNWLDKHAKQKNIKGINVISMGTHSRRSWILFKKHINEEIPVGIISLKTQYTPDNDWWKTSYGIQRVLVESVKYVYTLFL